ncbi:hypothetical protein PORY_000439 [Pneumocystis oryctolagi]|uniref:Uncharacterized protein n=1 Tax=Pneumocystis oryctolagi TaxID=42067 RepID=A0ACB7CF64_9ASCO|nr:hypothetical protein PORY_000439 [Pneumocystis oryctolagi]
MPSFDISLNTEELSISTDVRERDRIRLERELEKELNGFSFGKSSFQESSEDTVRPGYVDLNQTFFTDSPNTRSLDKHFQDFSMGISASSDRSSIERGVGLELGTPNLKNEFSRVYTGSIKSFDRPIVSDRDFSTVMKSPLESVTSDYGDIATKMKKIYSPFDKKTINVNFGVPYDQDDHELVKLSSEITNRNKLSHALKKTEKHQQNVPIVERDRNIMTPKFAKTKSSAMSRLPRVSGINDENVYPIQSKTDKPFWKTEENNIKGASVRSPKTKAIPRAFKSASGLMQDLGLDQGNTETNIPLATEMTQSFQLPDMTGIASLISDGIQPGVNNKIEIMTRDKYKNLESIPISSDDKAILLAIRTLQNNINELEARETASKKRIQNLEKELEDTKQLYLAEQKHSVIAKQDQETSNNNKGENLYHNHEVKECEKLSHTMERVRLKNEVSTLKSHVEALEYELSITKSKVNNIKEEKNETLKKLMDSLSEVDHLKLENKKLIKEIENLKKKYKVKKLENSKQKKSEDYPKSSLKKKKKPTKIQLEPQNSETDDETSKEYKSDDETCDEETDEVSKSLYKIKKTSSTKITQSSRKGSSEPTNSVRNSKKKNILDRGDSFKKSKSILENHSKKRQINTSIITDSESSDSTSECNSSEEYSSNEDIFLNQEPAWIQVENKLKTKLDKSKQRRDSESKKNDRSKSYVDVNSQNIIDGLARHNPVSCSVCSRRRQKGIDSQRNKDKVAFSIKTKQLDNIFEEENTLRPSMSPQNALSMVIIQLEDEFKHLKLKYQEFIQSYEKIDPAVGKKKRKALVGKLKSIIEELEAKADQIYALYDVAEITKNGDDILKKVLRSSRIDV